MIEFSFTLSCLEESFIDLIRRREANSKPKIIRIWVFENLRRFDIMTNKKINIMFPLLYQINNGKYKLSLLAKVTYDDIDAVYPEKVALGKMYQAKKLEVLFAEHLTSRDTLVREFINYFNKKNPAPTIFELDSDLYFESLQQMYKTIEERCGIILERKKEGLISFRRSKIEGKAVFRFREMPREEIINRFTKIVLAVQEISNLPEAKRAEGSFCYIKGFWRFSGVSSSKKFSSVEEAIDFAKNEAQNGRT